MGSSFKLNRGAQRKIEKQAKPARDRKAADIARTARADAPVLTGAYRDSITVESDDDESRVVTGVSYALRIEARHNVLARAMATEAE